MKVHEVLQRAGLADREEVIASAIAARLEAFDAMVLGGRVHLPAEVTTLLEAGGLDCSPVGDDEVERWRTDVAAEIAGAVAESYDVATAAYLLRVPADRLPHMILNGSVYAFTVDGQWCVPAWQFLNGTLLPGLATVLEAMLVRDPLAVAGFFTSPSLDLSADGAILSPIEWLASGGDPAAVAKLVGGLTVS